MSEDKKKILLTLIRGETIVWESADKVTNRLESIYRSWGESRILKLPFNKFRKKILESFASISNEEIFHHIVIIDYNLSLSELALWLSFLPPEKTVVWFHVFGDGIIRKDEMRACLSQLVRHSVRFFVSSHFMKTELEFLPKECTHVVPFPVDERYFRGIRTFHKKPSVAYVGRLCVDKGLLPLTEWWLSQDWDLKLSLYGTWDKTDGKYSRKDRNRWLRETEKLRKRILENKRCFKIATWKTPIKGSRLLKSTKVVVSFSQFPLEEFGLGLAEAIASGCAVICSDWMGHHDFLGAPLTKILPVTNKGVEVKDLKSTIIRLSSASKSQRQSQRLWAKERFSIKAVSRQLKIFYKKDLSRLR